jgi:glutathione synthase/RimK-type ligase-like ATP-grasp enzyme
MTREPGRVPRIAGEDRIPLNILFGLPDDRKAAIIVQNGGRVISYDLVGSVGILPHLSPERFATRVTYLDPGRAMPFEPGPGTLINHIAEPDVCAATLAQARTIAESFDRPCFNHPAAVMRTTRDEVSGRLAGIPGLTTPRTIRAETTAPTELRDAIAEANLSYPVLVRATGSHLGATLIRIETPDDVASITGAERDARSELYVTEFCDFMSPDRRYRKFRVVVIGEDIFLRHCIIAEHWMIHRNDRAANTRDEEAATFVRFDREWKPWLLPIFREIGARLGLDYFGVDCNIDETGRVLVFEANACMNILANTSPSPNIWDEPVARIKDALETHLASPEKWRGAASRRGRA